MKVVIVGGVAGGANVATRLRRLSEKTEVVLLEKGPYVSFANCGLPYHIGQEIEDRAKLLMQTPQGLKARYNIDVRVNSEVIAIDAERRVVTVVDSSNQNNRYQESYDELVLAVGAEPIRPSLPGLELPGVFTLRDMEDMDGIISWISSNHPERAVVVGGGYIGLEVAEQLKHRGMSVTIIEAVSQLLAPLDPEMAAFIHEEIIRSGAPLYLNEPITAIEPSEEALVGIVRTAKGSLIPADLVIMGIGVKPRTVLAKSAGIALGVTGGVHVNQYMQCSKPHIWAVGDVAETLNPILGTPQIVPLAGPANLQGRIVADNIMHPEKLTAFTGGLGTAIARVFSLAAASTGLNEKQLKKTSLPYQAIFVHPNSHAGYYPGAHPIALKLLFRSDTGEILGAQAVGKDGVDKRIDVIATAIRGKITVDELCDLELTYAPPFGSAKDAVQIAAMSAQNVMRGLVAVAHPWSFDPANHSGILLDVRDDDEVSRGTLPTARHIPLSQLRERLHEVPKDQEIVVYCQSGMRSYLAARILAEHGYRCRNLSGAFKSWSVAHTSRAV